MKAASEPEEEEARGGEGGGEREAAPVGSRPSWPRAESSGDGVCVREEEEGGAAPPQTRRR